MFTGLIEEIGTIKNINRAQKSIRISINATKVLEDAKIGDSIAVNGTCLTVVELAANWFTADVMPETVNKTVLATLTNGDKVNLERTLRVGDRLGGHIVSGHVDSVGTIISRTQDDNAIIFKIRADEATMRYVIKKGSIAIDGTSLTVVNCEVNWFSVSIIPHTLDMTVLGVKQVGATVNLETDIIGKYVEKLLATTPVENNSKKELTIDFFAENGFI